MTTYVQGFVFITAILYLTAAACYLIVAKSKPAAKIALALSIGGLAFNTLAMLARGLLTGRLPLSNGSEFLLSFAWFTVLIYIVFELKSKIKSAGAVVMLIAALLVGSILILMPSQLNINTPLLPALKSPLLTVHVITAIFAYGGFALAAGLAAMQLKNTSHTNGDEWVYRITAAGFAMLTLTIVLGAIWAEQAWGRYWNWDPKETWALITWIIYAIYFHLHRKNEWKGKKSNLMIIIGFVLVLFTFFGVSYLLSGLHSYN